MDCRPGLEDSIRPGYCFTDSVNSYTEAVFQVSYVAKKGKRKVQGVPQSQTAALPRPQEEEETDKSKQEQIEQTYKTKTKTYISGFACSSYVKSASVAGAEEIISLIQRSEWRCSSMLWSMKSMTSH